MIPEKVFYQMVFHKAKHPKMKAQYKLQTKQKTAKKIIKRQENILKIPVQHYPSRELMEIQNVFVACQTMTLPTSGVYTTALDIFFES